MVSIQLKKRHVRWSKLSKAKASLVPVLKRAFFHQKLKRRIFLICKKTKLLARVKNSASSIVVSKKMRIRMKLAFSVSFCTLLSGWTKVRSSTKTTNRAILHLIQVLVDRKHQNRVRKVRSLLRYVASLLQSLHQETNERCSTRRRRAPGNEAKKCKVKTQTCSKWDL